jgi:hypothetical protein
VFEKVNVGYMKAGRPSAKDAKIMMLNQFGLRKNPHPNPSSPRSQAHSGESP